MDLRKASRDPWVWGQMILAVVVLIAAPILPRYVSLGDADFALNRVDPDWIRWLGGILIAAGGGFAFWGIRSLGTSLTPGVEPLPGAALVITGAYAHSRHPIYLGVVLFLAGYTLAWSNWTLALLLGFIALQYFEAKARAEERWLLERYPSYAAYTVHVTRRVM
ncbi:MAG: methyltransferase family protein [Gemmatimonadales bacterium]